MSTTIDSRVVEMRFDNKHFESNVRTSISTLDKLKQSLRMDGATKGFEEIDKAAKKVDMNILGNAVDSIKIKFSALEVMAVTALSNITNSIINMGQKLVNAIFVDPKKSGLEEYETQIGAIQTILANTSHQGTNLQQVNRALDELNTYADKTIYNFTQMTRNIGTFTAAGIELRTATDAIKGIANLAAVSGSTSQQASTAMYQLSQALAAGKVQLMDWNSVVNAGMGGKVFQDALIRTSELLGTGAKEAIDTYGSFRESLTKTGWLTTEVLTETLKQFAGAYSEADLIAQGFTKAQAKEIAAMAVTAEDAATKVKTFTQLVDTLKEALQSGWTNTWEILIGDFEEAKKTLTEISDVLGGIVAKSSDARNALLGGAFSTGWKQLLNVGIADEDAYVDTIKEIARISGDSFEKLVADSDSFGDALEKGLSEGVISADTLRKSAARLWVKMEQMTAEERKAAGYTSEMVEQMRQLDYELRAGTVSMDEFAKKILRPSGRENVIEGLWNAAKGLMEVIAPVKEAFREIFPKTTSEQIYKLTESFKAFTEKLKLSETAAENLKRSFKGIFAIADVFVVTIREVINGLFGSLGSSNIFGDIASKIGDMSARAGDAAVAFRDWYVENNRIAESVQKLSGWISAGVAHVRKWIGALSELPIVQECIVDVTTAFQGLRNISVSDIADAFVQFKDRMVQAFAGAGKYIDIFKEKISEFIEFVRDKVPNIDLNSLLTIGIGTSSIVTLYKTGKALDAFGDIGENVGEVFEKIKGSISAFTNQTNSKTIMNIALAIGTLAASLYLISKIDETDLGRAAGTLAALAGGIVLLAAAMAKIGTIGSIGFGGSIGLILMIASIKLMADTLQDLKDVHFEDLGGVVLKFLGIVGALSLVAKACSTIRFGSAAGVLLLILSMKLIVSAINDIKNVDVEGIIANIDAYGAVFGALITLSIAARIAGQHAAKAGVGIIMMSIAVKNLTNVAILLGALPPDKVKQGVTAIAIMEGMFAGLIAVTSLAKKCTGTLIALTICVATLGIAVAGLSALDQDKVKAASVSLSMVMGMFGILIAVTSLAKKCTGTLIALTICVATLGIAVAGLSALDQDNVKAASVTLSLLIGALVASCAILSAVGEVAVSAMAAVVVMTVVVSILAEILIKLGSVEIGSTLETALSLSILLGALVASCAILSAVGEVAVSAMAAAVVMTIVVGMLAVILGCLSTFAPGPMLEIAASLSLLLIALAASCAILGAAAPLGPMALLGAACMSAVLLIVAAALGVLAYLDLGPMLEIAVSLSLTLIALSTAMAILTAVGAGAVFTLAGIGTILALFIGLASLNEYMPALEEFADKGVAIIQKIVTGMSELPTIDPSIIDAVNGMSKLILTLTASALIDGLMSWLPGESSLSKIADDLVDFGEGMKAFSEAVDGLNVDAIKASIPAAEGLIKVAKAIPNEGGWLGEILGNNDMGEFGKKLIDFGEGMYDYAEAVTNLNVDAITASIPAAEGLIKVAKAIPNEGGWLGEILGNNDMGEFGKKLIDFGEGMYDYAEAVTNLNVDAITASIPAAEGLIKVAKAIPNEGGWLGEILGNNDMAVFGSKLITFGEGMYDYAEAVTNLNVDAITASIPAAQQLVNLSKTLPENKFLDSLFGVNAMDDFAAGIQKFGEGLYKFSEKVSKIRITEVNNAIDSLERLVKLCQDMENVDSKWVTNFAKALKELGEIGMKKFAEAITGSTELVTSAITTMINNAINAVNGQKENFTGAFVGLIDAVMKAFGNLHYRFTTAGTTFISKMIAGVKLGAESICNAFSGVLELCLTRINGTNHRFYAAGSALMQNFIGGILENLSAIAEAFELIILAGIEAIASMEDDFYTAGENLVLGFAQGIKDNRETAIAESAALMKAAAEAAMDALEIHSPSKVGIRIGNFFGMGFVKGVDEYTDKSYAAGADVASAAKNGLREAVSAVRDFIESGIDTQPTIRPVLDLSSVRSGARKLSAMVGKNHALAISTNLNDAGSESVQNGDSDTPALGASYSFVQNNYSPKALSRIDIYRQTKNQFSALKGLVKT